MNDSEKLEAKLMTHIISQQATLSALEQLVLNIAAYSGPRSFDQMPVPDFYRKLGKETLQRMLIEVEKHDPALAARVTENLRLIDNGKGPFGE